jgi:hypothetical protein
MMRFAVIMLAGLSLLLGWQEPAGNSRVPEFRELFNGRDLTGWINVNTDPDTWKVRDGLLVCSGRPIGVMRSEIHFAH